MASELTNHVFCLLSFCFPLLRGNRNTAQIGYFSYYCDQTPDKKQFKGGTVWWGLQSERMQSAMVWKTRSRDVSSLVMLHLQPQSRPMQEMGLGYKISRHAPSDPLLSVRLHLVRVPQQPSKMTHHLGTRYSNTRACRRCFMFRPKHPSWTAL